MYVHSYYRISRDVPSNSLHNCYKISSFTLSATKHTSFQNTVPSSMPSFQARKQPQFQSDSSGKLLTSIKSLVRRPRQASSSSSHVLPNDRPRTSCSCHARRNEHTEWDWDLPMRTPTPQYVRRESYPPPSPSNISNQQYNNPRRGRRSQNTVISMADYLTLEQLENVWQQQDMRSNNPVPAVPTLRPPPTRTSAEKRALPRILQVAASQSSNSTSVTTRVPHQSLSNRGIQPAPGPGPLSRGLLRIDTSFAKPSSKSNKKAPLNGLEWLFD